MAHDFISLSSQQTKEYAQKLARDLIKQKPKKNAMIIGLIGELGSGKTTFVQGFCKGLGIQNEVSSPTFILERRYKIAASCLFDYLVHIDAYRIESRDEIKNLGWEELFYNNKNIIIIEWPDKILKSLPQDTLFIILKHGGHENERLISKETTFTHLYEMRGKIEPRRELYYKRYSEQAAIF